MWRYQSPIGDIYIKKLPDGRYGMIYDGIVWESCDTPQAAADNVYSQVTGCSDWDLYDSDDLNVPIDLSEWERI